MGKKKTTRRLLVEEPGGRNPLRRPRLSWVNNIKMDLGEIEWGDTDWIDLRLRSGTSGGPL
jgi:hypothetical protein